MVLFASDYMVLFASDFKIFPIQVVCTLSEIEIFIHNIYHVVHFIRYYPYNKYKLLPETTVHKTKLTEYLYRIKLGNGSQR